MQHIMVEVTRTCTICKKPVATPNYKTCETCRDYAKKRYDQKKLADPVAFLEKCNESAIKSRAKRKREDPDAYKASVRASDKKHYAANQAAIRERKRLSIPRRLGNIKFGAQRRGYEWAIDDDDAISMLGLCFYCGIKAVDRVHGLDRMDNARGYMPSNTVGCCWECNMMKKCLDARTFVDRCVHIKKCPHIYGPENHAALWPDTNPGSFSMYRSAAKRSQRAFELTKDVYDELTRQPCVFCRREITATNKSGIDRIDNGLGYVAGNMQSCCGECNFMRGRMTVDAFLEKVSRIAARAEMLMIPEMPSCLISVPRERNKPGTTAPTTKKQKKKTRVRTGDTP
jgi:hypothetical protein